MLTKLDHVGIVVHDLDKTLALYQDMLNLEPTEMGIFDSAEQGVRMALLPVGDSYIELLQPTSGGGRIAGWLREPLEAKGEGLWHISIFADDYEEEIRAIEAKGYKLEEELADFADGTTIRMAFLSPSQTAGHWIEIVDASNLPSG